MAVKAGVRLNSASLASTDTAWTAGSPYQTLIYGVASATSTTGITTVFAAGSIPGIPTEVSGFAIISPLIGDSNLGSIDPTSVAVRTANSNVQIDRNIIVNAGVGVYLSTQGSNAPTSVVYDNLIAGNVTGVLVNDLGSTISTQSPFLIVNNTIADNTTGLSNVSTRFNNTQAYVINDIFFNNHDLTIQRNGTGIAEGATGTLAVGNNLFYQNGKNNTGTSQATGTYNGFSPAALGSSPDVLGNLIGNPFFAQAEDPRPNGDTPATFFTYSNYDLTSRSVAINAADNGVAPVSDFLYRTPVFIAGHGFPGTGPASIGAYYYGGATGTSGGTGTIFNGTTTTTGTSGAVSAGNPTSSGSGTGSSNSGSTVTAQSATGSPSGIVSSIGGGIALGTKQFSVVNTSVSSDDSAGSSTASTALTTEPGPAFIDINFSDSIKPSTLSPTDLVLSGSGLSQVNPAHATSYAWIDDHAVRFYLSGGYKNGGTVTVSVPQGALTDTSGASLVGFGNTFQVGTPPATPPATATSPAAPVTPAAPVVTPTTLLASVLPVVQPVAAAPPVAAASLALATPAAPSHPAPKLTAKEQKQKEAAEAKALKAQKAAQAAEAKALKAAEAKAAKVAKAAAHKAKKVK